MTTARITTLTRIQRDEDDGPVQRPLDLGLIVRILGYTKPYAAKRNRLFFCVLLRAVQLPCLAWILGTVINQMATERDYRRLLVGVASFLALAMFTQFNLHFRSRWALELGEAVVHDMRAQIFEKLLTMPMSFFNRTKLGRIISRMTSDAEAVRAGVQDVMFITVVASGQMVVSAALMLWYDRVLFGLVMLLAPVIWGLNLYFRKRFSKAYRDMQESFSRVTSTLAESVTGIRVTQGFVRQDVNAGMFHDLVADHSEYNLRVARLQGVFSPLLDLSSQVFVAALILVGGYRVLHHQMSAEALVTFFFLAATFFQPISGLGPQYGQALAAMAGAERVFRLLDSEPEMQDPPDAVKLQAIKGRVEFRNLSFGYLPERLVLRDLNVIVEPGQTVALVGHTGSGKSSMINLISKFYLPTRGQLLIDDTDICTLDSDSLHKQMGIVLQVNFLFTGTVMDNIRVGRAGASDEEVVDAVRKIDCLDMFERLPDGLQTQVGERGSSMSLGQRQLVCFSRAMLANPRIMILDEATSSVDTLTEVRIQTALSKLLSGRTSFVVAHRLSTIRHADLVLVLDHGRIIERGTHNQLLATGGVYANLYRQFIRAHEA